MHRLLAMVTVGVLVTSLALPTAALASTRPIEYLAVGDSLAFGYNPLVSPADADNYVGYPDFVAGSVGDALTNAACPGETSGHFLDLTAPDRGCGFFRSLFPLHAPYVGTQIAFADAFLADHPKTRLVTIEIGANDVSNLKDACAGQPSCILAGLPAVLATVSANLDTIYGHLRTVDGYHHKLVALMIYSTDYADPALTGVVASLNSVVAARTLAWGGIVADGFGAWASAAAPYGGDTCAAGLRIVTSRSPLTCDDHPAALGHRLLAQAIVEALQPD
jgi:lysophospholipase L1-like esterase